MTDDRTLEHPARSALFTDLYELTMARAYDAEGMNAEAVFELFFRELPATRNYVVAVGIESVLDALEAFEFSESDLEYLGGLDEFSAPFLERLRSLRFTGDVDAMAEGTPVFANEPIVQVRAPMIEAQLVETLVLNQIHFQSVAATKAARVVRAAQGRNVVDFGSRRAHGYDAALKVARASYLVGADGTSNVLAGKIYGVPVFGTMAHSYIQAHDDEAEAMEAFARLYPETTLLVDTYDTISGVKKMIELARRWGERFRVKAIRLDSGDLGELAKRSRTMLDEAGLGDVTIFASSGLDEREIARLLERGAPIDGFGVGTRLAVSEDATDLDMAYKLVEYDGRPRMKLSTDKTIYPGRKQVFRLSEGGEMSRDVIDVSGEEPGGEPLLQPVMRGGKRLSERAPLERLRSEALGRLDRLPARLRSLEPADPPYPVEIGQRLRDRLASLEETLAQAETSREDQSAGSRGG
jgi:nicotinate phosphoribosyltransferase